MSLLLIPGLVYYEWNQAITIKSNLYGTLSSLFFEYLERELNQVIISTTPKYFDKFPKNILVKLRETGGMDRYSKVVDDDLYVYKLEDGRPALYTINLTNMVKKVNDVISLQVPYRLYSVLYEEIFTSDKDFKDLDFYSRDKVIREGFDYYFIGKNDSPYVIYPFYLAIDLELNLLNILKVSLLKLIMVLSITILLTLYFVERFSRGISENITRFSETAYFIGKRAIKGVKKESKLPSTGITEIDKIAYTLEDLFKSNYKYANELKHNNQMIKSTNNSLWEVLTLTEKLIACKINKFEFLSLVEKRTDSLEDNTEDLLNNLCRDISLVNEEKEEYLEQNQNLINKVLFLLGEMSEYRDDVTGAHINRVSEVAKIIGQALKIEEEDLLILENAAKLHDLGKIAIPDSILLKAGKLTSTEFEKMKEHCRAGYNILSEINHTFFQVAANISLTHHEWWDGSGYPQGLKGEEIPYESRIVAICDVFDALKSQRPYKEAFTFQRAFEIISSESGKHFDPKIVDTFIENSDKIIEVYKSQGEGVA